MEEEVNSGARTVARQEDSLSLALPNPEHTGRVRGRGAYRGWKDEFNGTKTRRKGPRNKVNKAEMESRLAQVREEVREQVRLEITMEYTQKMAELESRMVDQMNQFRQPSEDQPPVSPAFRRSSQASGTEVLCELDNLKVINTCS